MRASFPFVFSVRTSSGMSLPVVDGIFIRKVSFDEVIDWYDPQFLQDGDGFLLVQLDSELREKVVV